MTFGTNPVSTIPQASLTVGAGTLKTETVSQVNGQAGFVRFNTFEILPAEQPAGAPVVVTEPVIQGCVMVYGGTPYRI